MAETRRFSQANDFGFVNRQDDEVMCAASGAVPYRTVCQVIDDAAIYYATAGEGALLDIRRWYSQSPEFFPGSFLPAGAIPAFYRAILARAFFAEFGGANFVPTLRQMIVVLNMVEEPRGREDDYAKTRTAVKAILGVCEKTFNGQPACSPGEISWAAERMNALDRAETAGPGVNMMLIAVPALLFAGALLLRRRG